MRSYIFIRSYVLSHGCPNHNLFLLTPQNPYIAKYGCVLRTPCMHDYTVVYILNVLVYNSFIHVVKYVYYISAKISIIIMDMDYSYYICVL